MFLHLPRPAAMSGAAIVALSCTMLAGASNVDQRTILTFSDPVAIPGTTLPAGTYVFRLMDSNSSHRVIQVLKRNDDSEPIATLSTIPITRVESRSDVELRFQSKESGGPPALTAWFYPGTLHGHEFLYSSAQEASFAGPERTLVLSRDVPGTDLERGTLRVDGAPAAEDAPQH